MNRLEVKEILLVCKEEEEKGKGWHQRANAKSMRRKK